MEKQTTTNIRWKRVPIGPWGTPLPFFYSIILNLLERFFKFFSLSRCQIILSSTRWQIGLSTAGVNEAGAFFIILTYNMFLIL
jgi:hypothetical protein